jgi:hypothetical protein
MQLYIGEEKNKLEKYQLNQLLVACDFIAENDYSQLIDTKNEELNEDNIKMLDLKKANEHVNKSSEPKNLNIKEDKYNKLNQKD